MPLPTNAEQWLALRLDIDRNTQSLQHLEKLQEELQRAQLLQHQTLYVDVGAHLSYQSQLAALQASIDALQDAYDRQEAKAQKREQRLWAILIPLVVIWIGSAGYWLYQAIQMAQRITPAVPKVP